MGDHKTLDVWSIETGVEGKRKWNGAAAYDDKVYFAPQNASEVLVLDTATEELCLVDSGMKGKAKWGGAAACGRKVFFAPNDASAVLVIHEDESEALRKLGIHVSPSIMSSNRPSNYDPLTNFKPRQSSQISNIHVG